jgi:hypothetical protein
VISRRRPPSRWESSSPPQLATCRRRYQLLGSAHASCRSTSPHGEAGLPPQRLLPLPRGQLPSGVPMSSSCIRWASLASTTRLLPAR